MHPQIKMDKKPIKWKYWFIIFCIEVRWGKGYLRVFSDFLGLVWKFSRGRHFSLRAPRAYSLLARFSSRRHGCLCRDIIVPFKLPHPVLAKGPQEMEGLWGKEAGTQWQGRCKGLRQHRKEWCRRSEHLWNIVLELVFASHRLPSFKLLPVSSTQNILPSQEGAVKQRHTCNAVTWKDFFPQKDVLPYKEGEGEKSDFPRSRCCILELCFHTHTHTSQLQENDRVGKKSGVWWKMRKPNPLLCKRREKPWKINKINNKKTKELSKCTGGGKERSMSVLGCSLSSSSHLPYV